MKKLLLTGLFALVYTMSTFAQATSNLIVFVEDPKPFFAIVNGVKQNNEAQTNVKITGLTNQANFVKIVFTDGKTPDIDKNFYFETMNVEATARIVNTKKGYKLRYFGEVPMGSAPTNTEQVQVVYHSTETPATNTTMNTNMNVGTTVTEETVTTTTTTSSGTSGKGETVNMNAGVNVTDQVNGNSESVSMDVNVGGFNMNVDVNVNDNGMNTNTSMNESMDMTSTTTTTTTTTTTSSSGFDTFSEGTQTQSTAPVSYVPNYTGRIGCPVPQADVRMIKNAVEAESFSDDKLIVAKQAVKNKCLKASDIKTLAQLFDFEDTKLEFAKFAYDYTYDVDNYYIINSVFDFSSSKEELNKYTSNR